MKCYACGKKSEKNGSEFGEYKCDYYIVHPNRPNQQAYGVYIKYTRPGDIGAEDNIMLCSMCYSENQGNISIPDYIPEEQYKRWLKEEIKK